MRTQLEQWEAFVRHVNSLDENVHGHGGGAARNCTVADAWALLDMHLDELRAEELSS